MKCPTCGEPDNGVRIDGECVDCSIGKLDQGELMRHALMGKVACEVLCVSLDESPSEIREAANRLQSTLIAQADEIKRLRGALEELECRIQNTASTLRGAHVNSNDLLGRVLRDLRNLKSEALAPSGETK